MIRREVFEAVGRFSEDYFMYAEDVDLCRKVRRKGFKNYFVSRANVIHYGGGSSKQQSNDQWSAIAQREAILQLCRKTQGPLYALMFRAATAAVAVARLIAVFPVLVFGQATTPKQWVISTRKKWMAILRWSIGLETATVRSSYRRS
jgi:hypothetical protein